MKAPDNKRFFKGECQCEEHRGHEWPHGDCLGPGMPWPAGLGEIQAALGLDPHTSAFQYIADGDDSYGDGAWVLRAGGREVCFFSGIGGPDGCDQYVTIARVPEACDEAIALIAMTIAVA